MGDLYEPFEITDWDIKNEFNPNRHYKKQSKKEALYGVWASSDESDVETEKETSSNKPFNYYNFISSGVKQTSNKIEDNNTIEEKPSFDRYGKKGRTSGMAERFAGLPKTDSEYDFGKWESHTKGIGAKLLQKMGYEPGRGLGKNLQGITEPIEAKKRSGSGALGYYGPEFMHKTNKFEDIDETENKTQKRIKSERRWRKTKESIKKAEIIIKSADDIIAESLNSYNPEINNVKVIDMTGPEQRIYSGYHQIHQQMHEKPADEQIQKSDHNKENFNIPELEHNIELLVKIAEDDILESSKELRKENERYENLEMERKRLQEVIGIEEHYYANIENMLEIINNLSVDIKENKIDIYEALLKYEQIKTKYPNEFESLKMVDLLIPIAFPLIRSILHEWKPLIDPLFGRNIFEKIRLLTNQIDDGIYEILMWEIWMPVVRREILQWTSIRQCDEIISFIESWKPLMPEWLFENITEQIVLPLLQKEVEKWNPLTDTVPIHSWLHPWLPLMADKSLEHIYDPIRHKLSNALNNWHPSDNSARLILQPWRGVFSDATLEAFININIVPKLEQVMQNFEINPQQQCLDAWHWVMSWQDLITNHTLATILEKFFFQRWLLVLYNWLSNSPNFDEVSKWYSGWKTMFSNQLQTHPSVKKELKKALDMMNQAVTSNQAMKPLVHYMNPNIQPHIRPQPNVELFAFRNNPQQELDNVSFNFRQLIEMKAVEYGLLFMPIPNRFFESKQIYKFGNKMIYIDRQVIYVLNINTWIPTSIQALIDSSLL